jgi:hypothetical protein
VVGRNVGLTTATVVALVLVDIVIIAIVTGADYLVVAVRAKAAWLDVAAVSCDLGLRGRTPRASLSSISECRA